MLSPPHIAIAVVALLLAYPVGRGAFGVLRFTFSSWRTKWHYVIAWWTRLRWSWITRNLGLVKVDRRQTAEGKTERVTHYPRVRFRPDRYGLTMRVRTLPSVGKTEWNDQVEHLGNLLGCRRVQVTQPKPGKLLVRAVRRDPLGDQLALADAPQVIRGMSSRLIWSGRRSGPWPDYLDHRDPSTVYVGRDQWGVDRRLCLDGIAGVTVGGLPGYGKTSFVGGLLYQLAGLDSVQFAIVDGMGGVDYEPWQARAWLLTGDDLDRALAAAEVLHDLMRYRVETARRRLGVPNAWTRGPSPEWPLLVIVWDECHTFFDLAGVKGNRQATEKVQRLISLAVRLVKMGRKAMLINLFVTQKQTADAIPTAIRDVCTVGISYACRTREAAVAGLGDAIREFPEYCPTGLTERPTYVGVCTAALPDNAGAEPFTKLRTLHVTDDELRDRAMATADRRTPLTEINDARRWARTAPRVPDAEWLIPIEQLEAAVSEQAGSATGHESAASLHPAA